jgi:hypothetical protein
VFPVAAAFQPFEESLDAEPPSIRLALPDFALHIAGKIPPGLIGPDLPPAQKAQQIMLAYAIGRSLEGFDATLGNRNVGIG